MLISIHPPHAGRYVRYICKVCGEVNISIHSPHVGRYLPYGCMTECTPSDFNPLSLCGEIPLSRCLCTGDGISIHPPRTRRDSGPAKSRHILNLPIHVISIHSPRAGRSTTSVSSRAIPIEFQSTLPMRGGAVWRMPCVQPPEHFNPPSPCGEEHDRFAEKLKDMDFNPSSPCGEERLPIIYVSIKSENFNPSSPCGEERFLYDVFVLLFYFNPSSPCGEERQKATNFRLYPASGLCILPNKGEFCI